MLIWRKEQKENKISESMQVEPTHKRQSDIIQEICSYAKHGHENRRKSCHVCQHEKEKRKKGRLKTIHDKISKESELTNSTRCRFLILS